MLKKLLYFTLILTLFLTACGESKTNVTTESEVKTLINAGNLYSWTLEDAKNELGELNEISTYNEDGMIITYYSTADNKMELGFVAEGKKLKTVYLYADNEAPFLIEKEEDIYKTLGVKKGNDVKKDKGGATRYYDVDSEDKIREVYFMGKGIEFPLKATVIQIWYK